MTDDRTKGQCGEANPVILSLSKDLSLFVWIGALAAKNS